uniref:F-box/LRR-repeat protein 12-like n=1 Tax=Styela clava TaxID=7725 RepID=UPI0019396132|nr:F-box/LRR-repeat protein 12-like [Styela clava]
MTEESTLTFDDLPDNLYLEIFQYLPSSTDLLNLQRVSKRWQRVACDYWLWKKVKITPHPILKTTLAKIVRRYFTESTTSLDVCGGVWRRRRHMSSTVSLSNNVLSLIGKMSPKLREFMIEEDNLKDIDLSLLPSSVQRLSFTNCEIPTDCLVNVDKNFPELRSLLFRRCPILQDGHLALFGKLENLERLECYGCYRIDSSAIRVIAENFSNLKNSCSDWFPISRDRDCAIIAEKLPKLTTIEIEEWIDITMNGVTTLRKNLRNLKFLSIKCSSINQGEIVIEGSRVHV